MLVMALVVLFTLAETPFGSNVDRALTSVQTRNWNEAMTALDQARTDDPAAFETNNFYYLRGRIAEEQQDWARALEDFTRIDPNSSLRPLAAWHAARASLKLGMTDRAQELVEELPSDFPGELRIQLLRDAPPAVALKAVDPMTTREARLHKALLLNDSKALWNLLRDRSFDDAALHAARRLAPVVSTLAESRELAGVFMAQRQFKEAEAIYRRLQDEPQYAPEAQYQLARIYFLTYDYARAVEAYRAVITAFPGSNWDRDAQYQIGSSFWRLRRYDEAENAYLQFIQSYKGRGVPESAVRDLIDIYRGMGQSAKALSLIDRTLASKPSAATRQVLIFSKAKILYSQEKYSSALQVIRQLKGARLQNTAGGTSSDELVYFEALTLQKVGNASAAKAAWQRLASNPLSYYGQLAAQRLGTAPPSVPSPDVCSNTVDKTRDEALSRLIGQRRSLLTETAAATDAVTELMFLQLWDEAALMMDYTRKPNAALAADLQYVGGRFNRAISYADRMSSSNTLGMRYPAGYRSLICKSAMQHGVDPLWLHAIIWQESKYNPNANSGASARGLMQFVPDTAETIAIPAGIPDFTLEQLFIPETNIQLGAYYWASLMQEFKSPQLALAAYNAGPDNVRRWQDKWPGSDGEFFISEIGFVETKRYVQAVSSARVTYGRIN